MSKPTDRETLRNLISAVLPTDSDLEALCIDRFPDTASRFTAGMDRVQKVNLLLVLEGLEQILQAIQERDPVRYDQHRQLLSLPPRNVKSPMASQAASAPKQVPVIAKPTAANIKGGQGQDMTSASGPVHADVVIITALKEEYDEARKVDERAIGDWSVNHDLVGREGRIGPSFAPQTAAAASKPKPTESHSTQNSSEELAELKKKLESVLRRYPALVAALGKHCAGASDPAKAIAIALTGLDARSLVADLNTLTQKDSALQTAVRELLVHVLPLAVDWQSMVAHAEAKEHPNTLELPLRTMTLAEVINARLDNRSCVFAPGGGDLQGVAHVPMPSVSHAPFFDLDGQVMAQAVTSNLWKEQQTSGTPLPGQDAWSQLYKSAANKDEFCAAAQIEINKPNRKLNRYLLFIDATLAAAGLDDAALEASWRVTNQALKQTLPGLRLVRLKGRDAEWKQEYGLVSDIRDLHNP